jgi:hypothetical protein
VDFPLWSALRPLHRSRSPAAHEDAPGIDLPDLPAEVRLVARALARLISSGTVRRVDQGGDDVYALTNSGERLASDITPVAGALGVTG